MKSVLKKFLLKRNLYYPLKYSSLFRFYQSLFNPSELRQQKKEVTFYQSFLPSCKLIFDIGGNDGHKTQAFLALAQEIVCCEPDKENFQLLQTRFRKKKERVRLENKALSDKEGVAELHIHHPGSAFNTISEKWVKLLEKDNREKWNESVKFTQVQTVETTTLDQLISQYGLPDFIKIDTEGAEEWVLKGLSRPVSYLSFEILLPDYSKEMENCLAYIDGLDKNALYNISAFEKLVLPQFVSKEQLVKYLQESNLLSFDVIVKMSA
jgi:FkbM family methyltransferase